MMSLTLSGYVLVAGLSALVVIFARARRRRHFHPGPAGIPILGNIFDIPQTHPWLVYQRWAREYNVIHLRLVGTHLFIINATKASTDLFEKRSSVYSDKPYSVMGSELTGWSRALSLMPYGEQWREHRRLFDQHFRAQLIPSYHPRMQREVVRLLGLLLDSPDRFYEHVRFIAATMLLGITYGSELQGEHDPLFTLVETAVDIASGVAGAGSYLVDFIPVLKHLPAWFPGATFKRQAAQWKPIVDEMFDRPFGEVKAAFRAGKAQPCFVSSFLEDEDDGSTEEVIANVAGIVYAAGSDTSVMTLASFFLAMIMYPDVQRAAQEELDRTIGRDRLPDMSDQDSLPYITAILNELWRWRPPLPLGIPHKISVDDEYEGHLIPAGSIIVGNAWAILHDENRYADSERFNPARFLTAAGKLDPDVPDPIEAFGHGRRVCPGRNFAIDALWLAVSNILTAFVIEKPVDECGNIIEPSGEYSSGVFSYPKPFKATIKPRSAERAELIRSSQLCE